MIDAATDVALHAWSLVADVLLDEAESRGIALPAARACVRAVADYTRGVVRDVDAVVAAHDASDAAGDQGAFRSVERSVDFMAYTLAETAIRLSRDPRGGITRQQRETLTGTAVGAIELLDGVPPDRARGILDASLADATRAARLRLWVVAP